MSYGSTQGVKSAKKHSKIIFFSNFNKQFSNAMTKNAPKMRDRHNHVKRAVINYQIDNLVSVLIPSIDRAGNERNFNFFTFLEEDLSFYLILHYLMA